MTIRENDYYIGIDFGLYSVKACYIDQHQGQPTMMDRSGGFGQVYVPACMLYLEDEDTWLIGAEAQASLGGEEAFYINDILKLLAEESTVIYGSHEFRGVTLFAIFVSEIAMFVNQLNPKALIKGLCISFSDEVYFTINKASIKNSLAKEMKGVKLNLYIQSNTESLIKYLNKYALLEQDTAIIIDFGHTQFRAYSINKDSGYEVASFVMSEKLSGKNVLNSIIEMLQNLYMKYTQKEEITREVKNELMLLARTYFLHVFKCYKEKRALKVTYNFAFPPFQGLISYEELAVVIEPYESLLDQILTKIHAFYGEVEVIATGNGFRMGWPLSSIRKKSFKLLVEDVDGMAKGAAIYSHEPDKEGLVIHKGFLEYNYGFMMTDGAFMSVIKKGQHYKHETKEVHVIFSRDEDLHVKVYKQISADAYECVFTKEVYPSSAEQIVSVSLKLSFDAAHNPDVNVHYKPL